MDVTETARQPRDDPDTRHPPENDPPVKVSRAVYDGIAVVRDSGLTTMLNRSIVSDLACFYGYEEAAAWIGSHWREYAQGLCLGFDPTD